MSVIPPVVYDAASEDQKLVFDEVKKKVGRIPNIYAAVGQSPVMLKALLEYGANLQSGVFTPKEIEAVALSVGEVNGCGYCTAAHTAIAKMAGVSEEETLQLRAAQSQDDKLAALVGLAVDIVKTHGRPSQDTLDAFFASGYKARALTELLGLISLNVFTNYFNHIAETEIDFPAVKPL